MEEAELLKERLQAITVTTWECLLISRLWNLQQLYCNRLHSYAVLCLYINVHFSTE